MQEKLGYNVTQKVGPNTVDAFYALAGCRTPTNVTDRGCGPDMTTRVHLSTEGWTGGASLAARRGAAARARLRLSWTRGLEGFGGNVHRNSLVLAGTCARLCHGLG